MSKQKDCVWLSHDRGEREERLCWEVESLSERDEPHRGADPSGKVQEMEICQETELP